MSEIDDERVDEIASALEAISERIVEVSLDALREAVDSGATQRPDVDKRLASARRSVDKAVRTLRKE